jgi:polyphenol oxidase
MFVLDESFDGARLAFTGRGPGVGAGDYAGLNLADHVGDDPSTVRENRVALARALDVDVTRLLFMDQVHGDVVVQADGPWAAGPPACDALVTTRTDLALGVLVADCVPVLLAAPGQGVLGVAHAGRQGMAAAVVVRLVEAMRDLGARDIVARLGPSICPRCYPVPLGLREDVADRWPVARSVSRAGQPALDVAAGVLDQLAPLCRDVAQLPGCTAERPDLYSYRRDGRTGRFAGVARLAAPVR